MSELSFKDNFSKQSESYLKYRPQYPDELYSFLAGVCKERQLALDCGTGNGQAAVSLAKHFDQVVASDPSEAQIKNAIHASNVSYKVLKAEYSWLENKSVDLITVANALHWFRFELFYKEARRILKDGGVLATWCYGSPIHMQSAEINEVIRKLHDDVLGNFWLPENRLVEQKYKTIPFPFTEIEHPDFTMEKELNENDLLGLFHTWSAVQRYKDSKKLDPVAFIEKDLKTAWGKEEKQKFKWELTLKLGRN